MALSSLATSTATAIKVLAGSDSFELTRDDVNRHPDSLLHSLLASVETGNENAPLELDLSSALSTSKFSTFTHATAFTVAIYRQERLPVELLSTAATSHGTRGLFDKLHQLLDFLNLPGPVTKYLPALNTIPLRHVAVLDLHIEAAAQQAVDLMLGSSLSTEEAAFFCVRLKKNVSSHFEVTVYALSGLPPWPKGSSGEFNVGYSYESGVQAVQLPAGSSRAGGSLTAVDLLRYTSAYGSDVRDHKPLFERINTVLTKALATVPLDSRTGALHHTTFTARMEYWQNRSCQYVDASGCVWGVWW